MLNGIKYGTIELFKEHMFVRIKRQKVVTMKNIAYIDGQNLIYGTTHVPNPWNIDLKRFRIYLRDKYEVSEAYYFIGAYDARHQDLYNAIQKDGFILFFREHSELSSSNKKECLRCIKEFLIIAEVFWINLK